MRLGYYVYGDGIGMQAPNVEGWSVYPVGQAVHWLIPVALQALQVLSQ